jgi:hypothetical protein
MLTFATLQEFPAYVVAKKPEWAVKGNVIWFQARGVHPPSYSHDDLNVALLQRIGHSIAPTRSSDAVVRNGAGPHRLSHGWTKRRLSTLAALDCGLVFWELKKLMIRYSP